MRVQLVGLCCFGGGIAVGCWFSFSKKGSDNSGEARAADNDGNGSDDHDHDHNDVDNVGDTGDDADDGHNDGAGVIAATPPALASDQLPPNDRSAVLQAAGAAHDGPGADDDDDGFVMVG